MTIEHTVTIPVDAATVWALTIDVEAWPGLTSTITSVEVLDPPLGVGGRARIRQPGQRPRIWTVTRFEPERCFEWATSMGTVRLVGRHDLEVVDGGTVNRLSIELSGPGAGVLRRLAGRQLARAIATENEGFLRAATSQQTGTSGPAGS